jgi:5-methylcytosine-specific restriction endonuclease McrA
MHSKRCEPCRETYWIEHTRKRNKARTESGARRVYDERYRASNGETIRANNRKYKAAHPETDEAASARRRQRMAHGMDQLDRALSAAYRQAIRNDLCFYCGAPPAPDDETDHFFPLVKHGTDHWFNLVRTCQRCNRGPGGKHQVCGTAFMLTGCVPWRPLLPAPTSSSLMTAGPALPVLPPLPGVQMTMF